MKVRATKTGHYGSIREEGDVFELKDIKITTPEGKPAVYSAQEQFSEQWMEKLSGKKKQAAKEDSSVDYSDDEESDSETQEI